MYVVLLCRGPQVVPCQASVLSQLTVAVRRRECMMQPVCAASAHGVASNFDT